MGTSRDMARFPSPLKKRVALIQAYSRWLRRVLGYKPERAMVRALSEWDYPDILYVSVIFPGQAATMRRYGAVEHGPLPLPGVKPDAYTNESNFER